MILLIRMVNSDGYEVAVLKEIDKKLPQYKFEYTGTSDDDLLIGLESGKYDIGTKGAWYTDERAKKLLFRKIQLEQVLLDLPFVRMIKINIKISLILQTKWSIGANFTTKCSVECYQRLQR